MFDTSRKRIDYTVSLLQCMSADSPATLDELTALSLARAEIDALTRACVADLRSNPQRGHTWSEVAEALGSAEPDAVRMKHSPRASSSPVATDEHVARFWRTVSPQLAWDFLPSNFIHALFVWWLRDEYPQRTAPSERALIRRVKAAALPSREWVHDRVRPRRALPREPLLDHLPDYIAPSDSRAFWGSGESRRHRTTPDCFRAVHDSGA